MSTMRIGALLAVAVTVVGIATPAGAATAPVGEVYVSRADAVDQYGTNAARIASPLVPPSVSLTTGYRNTVMVSHDGKNLYALGCAGIEHFTIGADGTLTAGTTVPNGCDPSFSGVAASSRGLAETPSQKFLFAAMISETIDGFLSTRVEGFAVDPSGELIATGQQIAVQTNGVFSGVAPAFALATSSTGKFLYVASARSVASFAIDTTGFVHPVSSATLTSNTPTGFDWVDLAVATNQKYLFITDSASADIKVVAIDPHGIIGLVRSVNAPGAVVPAIETLSHDGKVLFVSDGAIFGGHDIESLTVAGNGDLLPAASVHLDDWVRGFGIASNGKALYASTDSGLVSVPLKNEKTFTGTPVTVNGANTGGWGVATRK